MIYITGDIHGDPYSRLGSTPFPEGTEMNKRDDYVIICGDFGILWEDTPTDRELYRLQWLNMKPFNTLFVDGNHENHNRLDSLPVEDWHGGKVHRVSDSVYHLMRGEIYNICDKKIFTFGGASSHDTSDGLLEMDAQGEWKKKAAQLNKEGKFCYRVKNLNWWERELPSEEEMTHGKENLAAHGHKVDYIVTHSPTASMIALLGQGIYKQDYLTQYLEDIRATTEYTKWFCGHMHVNQAINTQDIVLFEQILRIA